MSELRFETYEMPAGTIGPLNPHPQFPVPGVNEPTPENVDASVPKEEAERLGYGRRWTCLPYLLQDDLGRDRTPRAFDVAVLENDLLRAVFLLELGGRLWSLVHKPTGQELLYVNSVFQPGNLAIRNAWFSGGVEWNFGWTGHTPFTCDPLFAARAALEDGTPVLRLYEFERARGMPFQMDFYLPDRSPVLWVRVTLRNPFARTMPVYWWSNIAVPEAPDVRVLVPAESLYRFHYRTCRMERVPHPLAEGTDRSRPVNLKQSCDNFYVIPEERMPWIAALDGAGRGLFQASTGALRGRKLFVWGQTSTGRKWQRFLNPDGAPYIEIQAGLERTQASCRPLPPSGRVEWVEAYGLLETDPRIAQGPDWTAAWNHAQERMRPAVAPDILDRELDRTRIMAERPPLEILRRASGWGALEGRRRRKDGESPLPPATPFPDESPGPEQALWLELLERGRVPCQEATTPPASYMTHEAWQRHLDAAIRNPINDHWLAWLQWGVMHLAEGRMQEAREAWHASMARQENAWAARNLAYLAMLEGRHAEAYEYYRRAREMAPDDWRLRTELVSALLSAGRPREALAEVDLAPASVRRRGRFRLLEAQAATEADQLERAEAIFSRPFEVEDAREGEKGPADIWFEYRARRLARETGQPLTDALRQKVRHEDTPPTWLDFRM